MKSETTNLPALVESEPQLEELLTRPGAALIEFIKMVSSPLLILGAGGKMGPTLAVLARRAAEAAGHRLEVVAASRFTDASSRQGLEARGVKTVSCDNENTKLVKHISNEDVDNYEM